MAVRHHHLVHESDECNVWRIEWPIGTGLDWHHHGDSDAQIIMLEGELVHWVVNKDVLNPSVFANEFHRDPIPAGCQKFVYNFYQHKVVNEGAVTAVSLHVYRPPLREIYDEALEITP